MKEKTSSHTKPEVESTSEPKPQTELEQRAQFIAENEDRKATAEDRAGAEKELLAPNEPLEGSEITTELGNPEPAAWNKPTTDEGRQTPKVPPEDFRNPSKELVEKGMRRPNRSRNLRNE